MADTFRFELDSAGVRELLKSAEMQAMLEDKASRVMGSIPAEKGYESATKMMGTRAVAVIRAATAHAAADDRKNDTLLKGLNAARD